MLGKHKRWVVAVLMALSAIAPAAPALTAPSTEITTTGVIGQVTGPGEIPAQTAAVPAPALTAPAFLDAPPAPSADQMRRSAAEMDRIQQAWAARKEANPQHAVSGATAGSETASPTEGANALVVPDVLGVNGPSPQATPAPSAFNIYQNTALVPTTGSSSINEPTSATEGKFVFYTGNWYAARSTNGGTSYSYLNPYADMADFCCDQDVVWERGRNLFLWYRQGIYNYSGDQLGHFDLSVSSNNMTSYCTYRLSPLNLNSSWTSQWFDFPRLALADKNLYITTNMFDGNRKFLRMLLMRFPLDSLAACAGVSFPY